MKTFSLTCCTCATRFVYVCNYWILIERKNERFTFIYIIWYLLQVLYFVLSFLFSCCWLFLSLHFFSFWLVHFLPFFLNNVAVSCVLLFRFHIHSCFEVKEVHRACTFSRHAQSLKLYFPVLFIWTFLALLNSNFLLENFYFLSFRFLVLLHVFCQLYSFLILQRTLLLFFKASIPKIDRSLFLYCYCSPLWFHALLLLIISISFNLFKSFQWLEYFFLLFLIAVESIRFLFLFTYSRLFSTSFVFFSFCFLLLILFVRLFCSQYFF